MTFTADKGNDNIATFHIFQGQLKFFKFVGWKSDLHLISWNKNVFQTSRKYQHGWGEKEATAAKRRHKKEKLQQRDKIEGKLQPWIAIVQTTIKDSVLSLELISKGIGN